VKLSELVLENAGFKKYLPISTLTEVDWSEKLKKMGLRKYKKTEPIWAIQADKEFTVDTLEGDDISGKKGDYLCVGVDGEMWPIDQEIFKKTYKEI
jgi:hypothetical protein